jgi:hypothetical protein
MHLLLYYLVLDAIRNTHDTILFYLDYLRNTHDTILFLNSILFRCIYCCIILYWTRYAIRTTQYCIWTTYYLLDTIFIFRSTQSLKQSGSKSHLFPIKSVRHCDEISPDSIADDAYVPDQPEKLAYDFYIVAI